MTEAWLSLVIGVAISMASAALLWYCAKRCRLAQPPSMWASEGTATFLSLALVGLIVVGGAWTIKGAMFLVPDAIIGLIVGFVVVVVAMFAALWLLGPLPSEVSRARTDFIAAKPKTRADAHLERA
jgi:hypothetical protein